MNSATKSTSGWFSRQQCKPENEEPEKQQENKDSKESSGEAVPNVAEASSESEPERLVTKPDKSSDEHEMKPTGKDDQTSDEVRKDSWYKHWSLEESIQLHLGGGEGIFII